MNMRKPAACLLAFVAICLTDARAEPEIWTARGGGHSQDFVLWPGGIGIFLDGSARGVRGFWHGGKSVRVLFLEDGGAFAIRTSHSGVTFSEFSQRSGRDGMRAHRVEGPSSKWIGIWIWRTADGRGSRHVSLGSDGDAVSTPGLPGRWVTVSRGIRVEWKDGAIDLLQFEGDTAALRSWPPGVATRSTPPLESQPLRVGAQGFSVSP